MVIDSSKHRAGGPSKIDAAIEGVKLGAQRGAQTETILLGDN